jgi:hypothetical protein
MSDPKKKDDFHLIGIDFDHLEDFSGSIRKVDAPKDIPIIEEISNSHDQIKNILKQRKNSLKSLEQEWTKGNISKTVQELVNMKDKGVPCDFFNSAFMYNGYNKDYVKLEDYVVLLPTIEKLVNSKYEYSFRCGIKMVCMLFDLYSDSIRQCKKNMKKVDSKTMANYDKLLQFFENIPNSEKVKTRDLSADQNLGALLDEMKELCYECKK